MSERDVELPVGAADFAGVDAVASVAVRVGAPFGGVAAAGVSPDRAARILFTLSRSSKSATAAADGVARFGFWRFDLSMTSSPFRAASANSLPLESTTSSPTSYVRFMFMYKSVSHLRITNNKPRPSWAGRRFQRPDL